MGGKNMDYFKYGSLAEKDQIRPPILALPTKVFKNQAGLY